MCLKIQKFNRLLRNLIGIHLVDYLVLEYMHLLIQHIIIPWIIVLIEYTFDEWSFISSKSFNSPTYMINIGNSLHMTGQKNVWKVDKDLNILINY